MDKLNAAAFEENPLLEAVGLRVCYGAVPAVSGACFKLFPGQCLMIAGPNGAGKTTLLRAVAGAAPCSGKALYLGENLLCMKPARRAKCVGMLAQTHAPGYAFTVEEVVRLGRYASLPSFWGAGKEFAAKETELTETALSETGLSHLRRRSILTLSGGELQRVFLAQLLAQDPGVLLLDEPASHLDPVFQQQTFELVRRWVRRGKRAAVCVMHDLSIAKAYGTHILLMDGGTVTAFGPPDKAFTPANLQKTYHMDLHAWMRRMLEEWTQ